MIKINILCLQCLIALLFFAYFLGEKKPNLGLTKIPRFGSENNQKTDPRFKKSVPERKKILGILPDSLEKPLYFIFFIQDGCTRIKHTDPDSVKKKTDSDSVLLQQFFAPELLAKFSIPSEHWIIVQWTTKTQQLKNSKEVLCKNSLIFWGCAEIYLILLFKES